MTAEAIKQWALFIGGCLVYAFTLGAIWTKLVTKVNGLGGRVKKVEESCNTVSAEIKALTANLVEYRADAKEAISKMGRVEKGLDKLQDEVVQGNLQIGSTLAELSRAVSKIDKDISNRLTRVETLAQVEKKLGPMPTD